VTLAIARCGAQPSHNQPGSAAGGAAGGACVVVAAAACGDGALVVVDCTQRAVMATAAAGVPCAAEAARLMPGVSWRRCHRVRTTVSHMRCRRLCLCRFTNHGAHGMSPLCARLIRPLARQHWTLDHAARPARAGASTVVRRVSCTCCATTMR